MSLQDILQDVIEEISEQLMEEFATTIKWWLSPDLWFLADGDPLGYVIKASFVSILFWAWIWFERTYLLVDPDENMEGDR